MSEPRRTVPRLVSTLLLSAAVAVISVPAAQSAAPSRSVRTTSRTAPGDLYRGQQWTLGALHLPRAWKYSRGNGVTVAVLDTGVDGHQADLIGRVIDGPDFTGHARKPGSRYWGRHGTQMASLIAGHGHGAGGTAGIMGVAPEAKILSIRVTWELGDPMRTDRAQVDGSRDAIAKGIRYAADHGAQVISMSLGGGKLFYDGNPTEEAAINYALSKGVVLVASAGNDGGGPNRRNYPAAYPGVIAVGAVDRAFRPARFTNRHTYVSVAAPGVEIVSADVSGQGYVLGTGTSPSAALVAGMSALVKARYPRLTPPEIKQAIEEGTTHRPPDGRDTKVGTGVADAFGSLRQAAHINRAEHGGAAVRRPPRPSTEPTHRSAPAASGPDLMLIAVLSGGGTLMVLSLILGWRQRRRRIAAEREEERLATSGAPEPPGSPSYRPRSSAASARERRYPGGPARESRSPERSPWEPRSSAGASPFEPRSSEPPETSPWERRPSGVPSGWDARTADAPWDADPAEETAADEGAGPAGSARRPAAGSWSPTASAGSSWRDPSPEASPWESPRQESSSWRDDSSDESSWRTSPATGTPPGGGATPPAVPPPRVPPPAGAVPPPSSAPADLSLTEPFPAADRSTGGLSPHEAGPPAEPASGGDRTPGTAGASPLGDPAGEPPAGGQAPARRAPVTPGPLEPYETPAWAHPGERTNGNGRSTGGFPAVTQDFRVVDEPDPLSDAPIESSFDVGTPLADESWESIRRGFDRLKEDTRNWGSPYGSTASTDDAGADDGGSSPGSSGETSGPSFPGPDDPDDPTRP